MNKRLGFSSLFIASILFSTYGIFSRILNNQLSVLQQISYRYAIGTFIVLFVIFFIKREPIRLTKFLNFRIALFALLLPASFYFFIESFIVSKLSISISGFYAGTILSSLGIGYFFLKEKINIFGLIGLIFMLFSFFFLNDLNFFKIIHIGLIYGFISGVFYGAGSLIKKSSGKFSKEELLLVICISTAFFLQTLSIINHEHFVTNLTAQSIVSLFGFIVVALSAEYLTVIGFRNFDLYLGSIVLSLEIVFTIFFGIFFFHEYPTLLELVGILLIIVSVIFTNVSEKYLAAIHKMIFRKTS